MLEGLVLDKGCKPWKLRLGFLSIYRLLVASILLALAGLTLLASRADKGPPTFRRGCKEPREAGYANNPVPAPSCWTA